MKNELRRALLTPRGCCAGGTDVAGLTRPCPARLGLRDNIPLPVRISSHPKKKQACRRYGYGRHKVSVGHPAAETPAAADRPRAEAAPGAAAAPRGRPSPGPAAAAASRPVSPSSPARPAPLTHGWRGAATAAAPCGSSRPTTAGGRHSNRAQRRPRRPGGPAPAWPRPAVPGLCPQPPRAPVQPHCSHSPCCVVKRWVTALQTFDRSTVKLHKLETSPSVSCY